MIEAPLRRALRCKACGSDFAGGRCKYCGNDQFVDVTPYYPWLPPWATERAGLGGEGRDGSSPRPLRPLAPPGSR